MLLEKIQIRNYRSIEQVSIVIKKLNNSYTYCLLGVNESGKSSILNGIALFDRDVINYPLDFYNESLPVEVIFHYRITLSDIDLLRSVLLKDFKFPKDLAEGIDITTVQIQVAYPPNSESVKEIIEIINFKKEIVKEYTIVGDVTTKEGRGREGFEPLNLKTFFKDKLARHFWSYSHSVLFWQSSDKYLISDEIDLLLFSDEPEATSIPLNNCFRLAGIKDEKIKSTIQKLTSLASIRNLESALSDNVTKHIKKVWPEHPVEIKFEINNNKISLLIEDEGVKHKAKTTSQRSDGFRQFISFLLTLSTENLHSELERTVLLIDEPETHLHPQAQINLKDELLKISSNDNNNVVFYATHSNYMIDKRNLERNIRVVKSKNEKTELSFIENLKSTYSEVNYTIFNIPTIDYHNELYGFLEDISSSKLHSLPKDKKWINEKSGKVEIVSLSRYIRHSIHHPENSSNKSFTESQLKKSIEIMRKLKYEK